MEYETLRQFADSLGLVYLVVLFLGVIIFTFRPGTKKRAEEMAQIPFREDDEHGR